MFFGTSAFAVPSLRALGACTAIRAVVTQPDRPAGRGQRLQASPVKAAALDLGLRVLEPERLGEVVDELRAMDVDAFAVASYGKILPQAILDLPRECAFNVHPSMLPLYRGATPLQAQIRDLRSTTGVTIIAMDAGMDTGDILRQESSPLGARETYGELHDRLAAVGASLLAATVELSKQGLLLRMPQAGLASPEEIEATLTRPLRSEDLRIDWKVSAVRVDALVRSLAPQPGARGQIAGLGCKVLATRLAELGEIERFCPDNAREPGSIWQGTTEGEDGLFVTCGEGAVAIVRVVPPNRPVMSGGAFGVSLASKRAQGASR